MKCIGLLSDTHGYLHPEIPRVFAQCDEIWHAGDFGDISVAHRLRALKPLRGVFGNIDGREIRWEFPEMLRFDYGGLQVIMTHTGGYPGNYAPGIANMLKNHSPALFISGHSHILKVMYDKKLGLLHINPGAAGRSGFHKTITMMRLFISGPVMKDLEIIEFKR